MNRPRSPFAQPRRPAVAVELSVRAGTGAAVRPLLALAGSWLIAGLAQVEVRVPFTPVPVTGQTLGVLLVGASLGIGLGAASLGLYLAQGALGAPFFSGGSSGVSLLGLSSATGGYLWGFVLAAAAVGWLVERGWDRSVRRAAGAMVLGEVVLYAVGVPWLAAALGVSLGRAVSLGFKPFLAGDALKLAIAATLLPASRRLADRRR